MKIVTINRLYKGNNMSGICSRYLVTKNVFLHHGKQDFVASSFAYYPSSKQKRNNSSSYVSYKYTYIFLYFNILINYHFSSVIPVKLAYVSYESMSGKSNAPKQPVIVMHGLFGSKNNWNSLSKAIHQQTARKVDTWILYFMKNT